MKKLLKNIGIGFLSLFIIAVILLINLIWFKPFSINHFYQKVFIELVINQPELISQLGLPVRYFNNRLNDISLDHVSKQNKLLEKSHRTLMRYNYDRLNEQQRLSYDILNWYLADQINGISYQYYNYPVNQLSGLQSDLPSFMDSYHHVNDEKDARDYLSRLSKFPAKFSQALEGIEKREELGIIPPKFVIEKVLSEMHNFVNAEIEENILFYSFREKLKRSIIDEEKHKTYLFMVKAEIEQSVYPAYRLLINYFEQLYHKATTEDGVWKFPDGEAFYQYILKSHTHTNFTAEEIHQIGLDEVARIQSEMMEILTNQGYSSESSLGQLMAQLSLEERFLYSDIDDAHEQIIKDFQTIIDHIDNNLEGVFNRRPQARVEVRRVPEFKEVTSAGAYYIIPAADGSRPGVFLINLRNISWYPTYKMATLAYHEAIPGHHFQIALQQELKGVPIFRKFVPFTVYNEGWALYAEFLAWELGFHEDPFSNLGRLEAELLRAVRLVVDTGIHHKRWTREEAVEYMYSNTGMLISEVEAEIERYIVDPGQACAYKMGMIQILRIRQKAMDALGESFNLPDFHDVIIGNGSMPMPILEREVDKYIGCKLQMQL